MDISGFVVQLLNGLAGASSLFLVGAGLSLIFGVTRIVNFAHGSFYMLGIYVAYTLTERLGATLGFWPSILGAAIAVGVVGALVEMMLVVKDAVLYLWGPEDLLGPRAPGLGGAIDLLGRRFPTYDLLLIVVGPV